MHLTQIDRSADFKAEVLETPITSEVMDASYPDGLEQGMIDAFHDGAVRGKAFVIPRLQKAIKRFPSVPCLCNYLAVAYTVQGKNEQAAAAIEATLTAHPDYLFGRVLAAASRIRKSLLEEALDLLGPSLRLRDLYPETQLFHASEVKAYYHAAGLYHLAKGNEAACQGIIEALQQLVPDAPEVKALLRESAMHRIQNMTQRIHDSQRTAIRVKEPAIPAVEELPDDDLSFQHDEIFSLFDYGYDLPRDKILTILALPRETLVTDLKAILEDAIRTGPAVSWEISQFGADDEFTGPLNALHFLAELKAAEVLETVLEFFTQHSELLDMWLEEISFDELLYPYTESSLDRLEEWMKQPGLSSRARDGVVEAVASLALREPSRRTEVISWLTGLLEFFAASPPQDNILDTEVVSGMVWQLCEICAADTLPLIRRLYDLNLVSEFQVGTYESVEQDIVGPIHARKQRPAQSLLEYYRRQTTPEATKAPPTILRGGIESLLEHPVPPPQQVNTYAGRNDPCPCGSGRKFKKCCMK